MRTLFLLRLWGVSMRTLKAKKISEAEQSLIDADKRAYAEQQRKNILLLKKEFDKRR